MNKYIAAVVLAGACTSAVVVLPATHAHAADVSAPASRIDFDTVLITNRTNDTLIVTDIQEHTDNAEDSPAVAAGADPVVNEKVFPGQTIAVNQIKYLTMTPPSLLRLKTRRLI